MFIKHHKCLLHFYNYSKQFTRKNSVLVIAEHNLKHITPTTLFILDTVKIISDNVIVLIPCDKHSTIAKYVATRKGVTKVLAAENVNYDGFPEENFTSTILATQKLYNFSHIIGVSSKLGKSVLPRVAAKLDVPALTDIINVKSPDIFVRPIYAGSAFMTVKVMDPVKVVMIKEVGSSTCKGNVVPIEAAPVEESSIPTNQKIRLKKSMLPLLSDAKTVICGGGGMRSAESFKMLYDLAVSLEAAVGATKSAVDRGYAPRNLQIGQIGAKISPDLYIGIGVSGNSEHVTGIKDSKLIVAINNDRNAPVFKVADYGVVMDLFDALPTIKYLLRHF
ncbi:hypothetical protein FQA39_LY00362 [Lamprigera yunnana]|nr:hypothetical protein FQA39_LY00362 [Lamprigera yunnana]